MNGHAYACFCLCFILTLLAFTVPDRANAEEVTWAKTFGGPEYDISSNVQQTPDGGYLLAGSTSSFGTGGPDFWLIKTDSLGNVEWEKSYGTGFFSILNFAQPTSDGGYFIGGYTSPTDGDFYHTDFWLLKLDSDGEIEWQKMYGGDEYEIAYSAYQTADGGYIVTGYVESFGAGSTDTWVLKLDSDGNIEWEKTYGTDDYEVPRAMALTSDGGAIVASESHFTDSFNMWLLKVDSDGNVDWEKFLQAGFIVHPSDIQQTADGGYVLTGQIDNSDFWIVKLDSDGNVEWEKAYGTEQGEFAFSIQQTSDGGYVAAGSTDVPDPDFNTDFAILKMDSDGNLEWERSYGGPLQDFASSIREAADGGYIVLGSTHSYGQGNLDLWALKLDSEGNIGECASDIQHDIEGVINDTELTADDTSVTVQDSDATVTDTDVSAQDSDAVITDPCATAVYFYTLDLSTYEAALDEEVQASTSTTDPFVDDMTFRWIKQNGEIAREITLPVSAGGDTFAPDTPGDWTIEVDFQNGQVIRKTLSVGFFVLPESPIGAIAMIAASLAVLGFVALKSRRTHGGDEIQ